MAAYGVIMSAVFLFVAVFEGYAVGSAPIVSFHYGARNHTEVHNLYRKSLRLIAVVAVTLTLASMFIIPCVARIFVGYDAELTNDALALFGLIPEEKHALFKFLLRCVCRIDGLKCVRVIPRIPCFGGYCHGSRRKVLHLFKLKIHVTRFGSQLSHVHFGTTRVRGYKIGYDLLVKSSLAVYSVKHSLEFME